MPNVRVERTRLEVIAMDPLLETLSTSSYWVISILIVLVYAHGRFNTPKSNRASTTLLQYYVAAISYYLSSLALFAFLSFIIIESPMVISLFSGDLGGLTESWSEQLRSQAAPLLAALVLTALLPQIPILGRVDEWLLERFKEVGRIPAEALRLAADLRRGRFQVPDRNRDTLNTRVTQHFSAGSMGDNDIDVETLPTSFDVWVRNASLFLELEEWERRSNYSAYLNRFKNDYERLKAQFSQINEKATRCFPLISGSFDLKEDTREQALVNECCENFKEKCDALCRDLCQFIAQGVLSCEVTESGRLQRLREMGFTYTRTDTPGISVNTVIVVSIIAFLTYVAGLTLISAQAPPHIFRIALMVSVIYGVAVAWAVWPKTKWRFANRKTAGERPYAGYLISGVITVACAVAISTGFKALSMGSLGAALNDVPSSWPWFLMSLTLAMCAAFLIDDYITADEEPAWLRWTEGGALAVAMVGTFFFVRHLFQLSGGPVPSSGMAVFVAAVSFAIGASVPVWYRVSSRRHARRIQQSPAEGLQAAHSRFDVAVSTHRPKAQSG